MDLPNQLKINLKYTVSIEVYAINSFPFYVNFMEISVIDGTLKIPNVVFHLAKIHARCRDLYQMIETSSDIPVCLQGNKPLQLLDVQRWQKWTHIPQQVFVINNQERPFAKGEELQDT